MTFLTSSSLKLIHFPSLYLWYSNVVKWKKNAWALKMHTCAHTHTHAHRYTTIENLPRLLLCFLFLIPPVIIPPFLLSSNKNCHFYKQIPRSSPFLIPSAPCSSSASQKLRKWQGNKQSQIIFLLLWKINTIKYKDLFRGNVNFLFDLAGH